MTKSSSSRVATGTMTAALGAIVTLTVFAFVMAGMLGIHSKLSDAAEEMDVGTDATCAQQVAMLGDDPAVCTD